MRMQDACAELTSSDAKRRQQADSCQAEFRKVVDSIQKDKQENYIKVFVFLSLSLCVSECLDP